MLQLRTYQRQAIDALGASHRAGHRRTVLVAPTGSGKTVLAGSIIQSVTGRGGRVLFLAHRQELIEQPSKMLDYMGIDHGVIKSGHWRVRPRLSVQVASVQTLVNRLDRAPSADLIIVDETHRIMATTYTRILDRYQGALTVGLTATPWRLDGRGLGDVFSDMIVVATVRELVDDGHLISPRTFAPSAPDLSGVRKSRGDYNGRQLAEACDRTGLIGDIVSHWQRLASGRKTVCFATSVEHSKHIVNSFCNAGVRAEHLDGGMPDGERKRILRSLSDGDTMVLSNVDVVTEGYDLPALSCAILARPTTSITKYLQMVGRIMRPSPDKDGAVVLDHANCTGYHGLVTDDREMSLERSRPVESKTTKKCPRCFQMVARFDQECSFCGYVFSTERERSAVPTVAHGELVEVSESCQACGASGVRRIAGEVSYVYVMTCDTCGNAQRIVDKTRAQRASMAEKRQEYDRIRKIAEQKGYKQGWIAHQYRGLFGCWPRKVRGKDGG